MNDKFEHLIERATQLVERIEAILPQPLTAPDWSASIAWRYRKRSSGHGTLEPVQHVSGMRLADLKEIDGQKEKVQRNTEQFVRGLRLIEVDKADLTDLPDIIDVVAERPEKFIVYCDDLSFEDGEPGYKALK
ncbi:MAG: hypothetical protein RLZ58_160, partial [Pseudomonadota bacterium]